MVPDVPRGPPPVERPHSPLAEGEAASPERIELAPAEPSGRPTYIWTVRSFLRDYFVGDDPSFGLALVPFCFLSMVLFTRHPTTNFIFDEQEALLANPFVRSIADPEPKFRWVDAFYRDFWGLGPERSIGSYRPIPNLVWRALWGIGAREQSPFLHHWVNVLLHGVNGALLCVLAFHFTKNRGTAWLAGAAFTACAVLTEAVSGVVGIADVLGATGALLALLALSRSMPWMGGLLFLATLFGLYSKESALCCVPLVPVTALLTAQLSHPRRPRRWARAAVASVAVSAAFVLYVEARRRMFPAKLPAELAAEANAAKPLANRVFAALLRWYAQPSLPKDPLNNPLVDADALHRVAGALRVYFRGLLQIVFPWTLSGDYSAPQEPIPTSPWSVEIVGGALAMILPAPLAAWLGVSAFRRAQSTSEGAPEAERRDLRPMLGAAALWVAISYFPVSNIPVLLPTVRAERFWYFPAIGTSLVLGVAFSWALTKASQPRNSAVAQLMQGAVAGSIVCFFLMQAVSARRHAFDYKDDLAFWDATRKAVPRSAKAHLNYSVMKGARGDLEARLASNRIALDLAPDWAMANIYYGDTLCRLHRPEEAWPHYVHGFKRGPNDVSLIALALQCLWDEKMLEESSHVRTELAELEASYPGTWVAYLVRDIIDNGEENGGVDPKHRPRGYNEGPKDP